MCLLSWSRALDVEFVDRANTLYDNSKLVVLDRDEDGEPVWNERFLDFALRVGFEVKLCRSYRARTKGKTERGVGYVEGNFWPGARFTDRGDLNQQAQAWIATVADVRVHGTTHERPADRLAQERLAVHPRASSPGRQLVLPGQWDGLPMGDEKKRRSPAARQLATAEVEARSLSEYARILEEVTVR